MSAASNPAFPDIKRELREIELAVAAIDHATHDSKGDFDTEIVNFLARTAFQKLHELSKLVADFEPRAGVGS